MYFMKTIFSTWNTYAWKSLCFNKKVLSKFFHFYFVYNPYNFSKKTHLWLPRSLSRFSFSFVNLVKVEFKSITNYSPEMNELDVFFKESNYLLKQYSLLPRYPFVFFTTSRTFEITSSLFFNKIFSYMILNNHEIILQMHFVIHRKYFEVQVHLSHQCWRCYWPSSISLFWWRRY